MRTALVAAALTLAACATFTPAGAGRSIAVLENTAGATCTAWAIAPAKWLSAKHCFVMGGMEGWTIAGTAAVPLALDPASDVALLSGPLGTPLPLSPTEPPLGAQVTTYGYGLGKRTLLIFPTTVSAHADPWFAEPELILTGANGMPGMSGGPVLWRGRVVGQVSGGGGPTHVAHLVGSAVPWQALREFARVQGVGR